MGCGIPHYIFGRVAHTDWGATSVKPGDANRDWPNHLTTNIISSADFVSNKTRTLRLTAPADGLTFDHAQPSGGPKLIAPDGDKPSGVTLVTAKLSFPTFSTFFFIWRHFSKQWRFVDISRYHERSLWIAVNVNIIPSWEKISFTYTTTMIDCFVFSDERFRPLFRTKMTKYSSFFTKTFSLLNEFPNITGTLNTRSAVECAIFCLTDTTECQHFVYTDPHGAEGSCLILM